MDAVAAVAQIKVVQTAFQVLVMLQLTAIFWPEQLVLPPTPVGVPTRLRYDYVIVGAGSAGCVIANRLTEDKDVRVLLIEAGADPPFETMLPGLLGYIPHTPQDWNFTDGPNKYRAIYQNNQELPLTQGKMLGGGSSANYMFYVRGNPHDYQTWADSVNDESWNYSNILQYFKRSEKIEDFEILNSKYRQFHGTSGYMHVTKENNHKVHDYANMFRELGHDFLLDTSGVDTLGYSEPLLTIAEGVRQSTAFSFLRPIKNRHNLDVLKLTLVVKILFDEFNNAIGVQALTEDRKTVIIMANKEVVVTTGAFNSPKLLLLSGIGPKTHLESLGIKTVSNLPVGHNLQDHPAALLAYKFKRSNSTLPPTNYAEFPFPALAGYVALEKHQTYPDYQAIPFVVPNDSPAPLQLCSFNYAIDYNICQAIYDAGKGRELLFVNFVLLHPKSRGTVKLRSVDPKDDPLISINSYSDDSDQDKMAKSLEDFDKLRISSLFKNVDGEFVDLNLQKCRGLSFGSREYWRCHALSTRLTMYHYSGTCAMGSVLDARLRVRGVQRLRVADSSAMPTLTSGNINAPVIMIAEKAADMIKEDNYEWQGTWV